MKPVLQFIFLSTLFISCSKDKDSETIPAAASSAANPTNIEVPANYNFFRNGVSTVNYSGQTSRLNQLEELSLELKKANTGTSINSQLLMDMFANQNDPFSQAYPKDLKSKTFALDTSYFSNLLLSAAQHSGTTTAASSGVPGLLSRSNGSTILVDSSGREYVQLIEKGLMGATFFNQIANIYLSASKIGPQVDNLNLADTANGKFYTSMEHHFDEAFGYMGFPEDFTSNYAGGGTVRFWGKYSNNSDPLLQLNNTIMTHFKTGRAAIVAKNYLLLDQQVEQLHAAIETLIAATAIHYLNVSLTETQIGERHHALSEAYAFVRALRYASFQYRKIDAQTVTELWNTKIGTDFYGVDGDDLNEVKNTLSLAYGLEGVKNQL